MFNKARILLIFSFIGLISNGFLNVYASDDEFKDSFVETENNCKRSLGDATIDNPSSQVVDNITPAVMPVSELPKDVWRVILFYASEHNNPLELALVSKTLYRYMYDHAFEKKARADIASSLMRLQYTYGYWAADRYYNSQLNPFMRQCLTRWWASEDRQRFGRIKLHFTPKEPRGRLREQDCMHFKDSGAFDLPQALTYFARITTSFKDFMYNYESDASKVVILIITDEKAREAALSLHPDHLFVRYVNQVDRGGRPAYFASIFIRSGQQDPLELTSMLARKLAVSYAELTQLSLLKLLRSAESTFDMLRINTLHAEALDSLKIVIEPEPYSLTTTLTRGIKRSCPTLADLLYQAAEIFSYYVIKK